jgi:very-short-patch-repair endonuclease
MLPYNKALKGNARTLRTNMTDAELYLWSRIRGKQLAGYLFYRQKTIGDYIVDFYCPAANLVIEVDGSQHYQDSGVLKDKVRDAYLNRLGLRVLRYSDREVLKEIEAVMENIHGYL